MEAPSLEVREQVEAREATQVAPNPVIRSLVPVEAREVIRVAPNPVIPNLVPVEAKEATPNLAPAEARAATLDQRDPREVLVCVCVL